MELNDNLNENFESTSKRRLFSVEKVYGNLKRCRMDRAARSMNFTK